jgi:SAM-dependent methyltransferase
MLLRLVRALRAADSPRCFFCVIYLHALERTYGFDPWHAAAPYACRPYKARVVAMAQALSPPVVVDLGCGLGEVIARIDAPSRFGFDPDKGAIGAAGYLFGKKVSFAVAALDQPDIIATAVKNPIDLLIMNNWPHRFAIEEIAAGLKALCARIPVNRILIDSIKPELQSYKYRHSPEDLRAIGKIEATLDGGDGIRDLHIVRVNPG